MDKWGGMQTCFFRQFFGSVTKVDYLTLRHGFIMVNNIINYYIYYILFNSIIEFLIEKTILIE